MSTRPSARQRRQVYLRAAGRCEYCLVHQNDSYAPHQIDHVIAEKHGGTTILSNLALSCVLCNRRKGSDISSVDPETRQVAPLYNPRTELWSHHFSLEGLRVVGKTPEGRATVALLQLNRVKRQLERQALMAARRYPES